LPNSTRARRFGRTATFLFAFFLGVGVTAVVSVRAAPSDNRDGIYAKLEIFAKVVAHIENNYVEEVDESKLIYGAIRGMVTSLDPHSAFLDPTEFKAAKEDARGEFAGLGFEFSPRDDGLVVLAPIDDSPAAHAGIRTGDVIMAIDNVLTRTMTVVDASVRLKGPPGTSVKLLLMRREFSKPREFTLVRDHVRIVSVDGRLIDGVGYVRIKSFQNRTDSELKKRLTAMRQEAGPLFKGVVLDLRNDPGGLLDEGVRVADRFLSKGVIVTTRGRGGRHPETEMATEKDTEPNYPLVVLINRGTASSSEVVAGALQDNKRAVLMGTTSFGKGSVQTVIDLDDGSALKLTVARYYTPSGRSIQGRGIAPDVLVPGTEESDDRGEDRLPGQLANDAPGAAAQPPVEGAKVIPTQTDGEHIDDVPLRSAISAVRSWDQFQAALEAQRSRTARPH
jgi:carboxyl-terminal processing protease